MKKAIYIILLIVVAIAGYMFWKRKKSLKTTHSTKPFVSLNNDISEVDNGVENENINSVYVVKKGDTLSLIANKKGVSLEKIIEANPQIKNPNMIFPGQKIYLP